MNVFVIIYGVFRTKVKISDWLGWFGKKIKKLGYGLFLITLKRKCAFQTKYSELTTNS
jgi:hypothetical protein